MAPTAAGFRQRDRGAASDTKVQKEELGAPLVWLARNSAKKKPLSQWALQAFTERPLATVFSSACSAVPTLRTCSVTWLSEYEPKGVTLLVLQETSQIIRNLASVLTCQSRVPGEAPSALQAPARGSPGQPPGQVSFCKQKAPQHRVFPSVTLYK